MDPRETERGNNGSPRPGRPEHRAAQPARAQVPSGGQRPAARPGAQARARAIEEQLVQRRAQPGAAQSGRQGTPPGQRAKRPDAAQQGRAVPRHARQTPKKKKRAPGGCGFFACVAVVILSLSWVITTLIELPARQAAASSLSAAASAGQSSSQQALGAIGPVLGADTSYTQPTAALMALPEAGRVDMGYFDDALFIGDSLTKGFEEYPDGALSNAKFVAYLGAGPLTFIEGTVEGEDGQQVAAMDIITAAAPKKVYILLGTNSMVNLSDEAFLKYYNDMLDTLQERLPGDTVFYIQAIPPVSAQKAAEDEKFTLERIQGLNESLAKIAYDRGLYFLDLYTALAGEDGALEPAITAGSDGIHLNNDGYGRWREFLVTHTAYRKDNPYLPGSPYYQPAAN